MIHLFVHFYFTKKNINCYFFTCNKITGTRLTEWMCTSRHAYSQLTTSVHAKAKHNGNAWKISGYVRTDYILSALWVIHKCSEVRVKCIMKPDDKIFFFLPVFSIPTWIGLAGSVMPWKWCQYNSETAAREHKTLWVPQKQSFF